jgi:hypothetical protein
MKTWEDYIIDQKSLCKKVGVKFVPSDLDFKIGLADNVFSESIPVNGLRHNIEGVGTGWFIWSGENFSNAPDFFKPHCVKHLIELKPEIIKYLGLPPGHRFLIDNKGYEDIWFDENLLTR